MDFWAGNDALHSMLHKRAEWHADRRKGIGGSDAGTIMSGDWQSLWLEKTGRTPPEDLSHNLAVAMGVWSETLNRYWFTQETGIEVHHGAPAFIHKTNKFMRANLDGWTTVPDKAVFEAKHVNSWTEDESAVSNYYAQCQHLMEVAEVDTCYLSVFFGSNVWKYFDIGRDDQFIAEMMIRERDFWSYVERDEAPPTQDVPAPIKVAFDEMRVVDLSTSNAWSSFADDWIKNRAAAKAFEAATKELKLLVEPDVKLAFGAGISATRSKAGSITIKEAR